MLCAAFLMIPLVSCDTPAPPETTDAETQKAPETEKIEAEDKTVYIDAKDYYNGGYTNNYIVGIDKLGRSFDAAVPKTDKNRQVGIFYFLTLGQHLNQYSTKIYDTTKILQMENGLELMFSLDHLDESIAPAGAGYFWSEPLYSWQRVKNLHVFLCICKCFWGKDVF